MNQTDRRSISIFSLAGCLMAALPAAPAFTADGSQSIAFDSLAEPPTAINRLIARGAVKFTRGKRSDAALLFSSSRALASKASSTSTLDSSNSAPTSRNSEIIAETTYRLAYRYRSSTQWTVRKINRSQKLTIKIHYANVSLEPQHVVWLKEPPAADQFWTDQLVLHELDHVRISSDPRWTKKFEEMLQQRDEVQVTLSRSAAITDEVVNRLVAKRVEEVFQQINELVAIRYRELDRLTSHGTRPVPTDSPLNDWLRHEETRP